MEDGRFEGIKDPMRPNNNQRPSFPTVVYDFLISNGSLHLSNELNNTTGLVDLALSLLADVAGLDDERNVGETALSENLGVTEREKVEDNSLVGRGVGAQVLLASLLRNKSPELSIEISTHGPPIHVDIQHWIGLNLPCPG
jgi:hypothetical protein